MAVLLSLGGGYIWWQGNQAGGGVLLRSGLVLGAIWLAWPGLVTINRRWLLPALLVVAFAVSRPVLLIWLAPALLAYGLLRRRRSR
jgi:hypothetical protein